MRTTSHPTSHPTSQRFWGTRLLGVIVAAALLTVATASRAPADPPGFDAVPGSPTIGTFNPVTLNGTQQLTSASIAPFVITDASGTLAGWHVTMFVPSFLNGTGPDCSVGATGSIDGVNVSMSAPVVSPANVLTDMTGVTTAGFADFTTPRTIISATVGEGDGTYDVSPATVKLIIPANALAGTYCTQATIAIISGP
jgi:hypothetical protein